MLTAKDIQLIQEVDEHSVPKTDFSDNALESTLRLWAFERKFKYSSAQVACFGITYFGPDDLTFESYADTLRKSKFQVELHHGFHASDSLRFHQFSICWHYAVTNGKLY